MNKVWKIRNINTGLFSMGGSYPRWTKKGKNWTSVGAVKLHLISYTKNLATGKIDKPIPKNWEVVEFEFTPIETTYIATDFIK